MYHIIRSRVGSRSILTACPCPLYARTCLCVCECAQFVLYVSQLQWHAVYKTSVGIYTVICFITLYMLYLVSVCFCLCDGSLV